jgi:hypothetical protein
MVAVAESFAVLGETAWLKLKGVPLPFVSAVLANAASAGLGLMLRATYGVP